MDRGQPKTRKCQRCGERKQANLLRQVQTSLGLKWQCFACRNGLLQLSYKGVPLRA